jgi:hypothetical protein
MNEKLDINFDIVKKAFLEFFNNKKYMTSIIIMSILSYGFYLINISIGIDDLTIPEYIKGPYALVSGRYTYVAFGWILQYFIFTPFWIEFFCILVLIISLILINVLLKIISNNKLPENSYILFSIMFISYSIISESLIYQENIVYLAFGYLFTIICIMYTYKSVFNRTLKNALISILFFVLALGLYETFLSVYLILISIALILELYYNGMKIKFNDIKFKKYFFRTIEIILYSVFIKLTLQQILNFSNTSNVSFQFLMWFDYSIIYTLKVLFISFYKSIICSIGSDISFSILLISFIAYIILALKIKNSKLIFAMIFVFAFAIQIIMGIVTYNRMLNSLSLYVAFAFCLLYAVVKSNKAKKIIFIFTVYLCLLSSKNINNELYKDFKRYNYEKYIINQTAFMINNKYGYTDKPVIFLGKVNTPFTNTYNSEIGKSAINWSITAFKKDLKETQRLFLEQGHKFNLPTLEEIKEASEIYESLPEFPQEGSVKLINDEYIIVHY